MTPKQKQQFNTMLHTLKKISKHYQTPTQLQRNVKKQYGLDYNEILEMAYENIQQEAKNASRNVRAI